MSEQIRSRGTAGTDSTYRVYPALAWWRSGTTVPDVPDAPRPSDNSAICTIWEPEIRGLMWSDQMRAEA